MSDTIDPIVAQARDAAALRLAEEAALAETDAVGARSRASDPDDPITAEVAAQVEADAADKRATADVALDLAPSNTDDLRKKAKDAHDAKLAELLPRWRADLLVHIDMRDNPDAYGGCDLGGKPLDYEEQENAVRSLTAAINNAESVLNGGTKTAKKK